MRDKRDTDGFELVTGRKKRVRSIRNDSRDPNALVSSTLLDDGDDDTDVDCDAIFRKLLDAEVELKNSPFCEHLLDSLERSLNASDVKGISEILCYGLGRFSRRRSSKYQLALLVYLKRLYDCTAYVYDPVFRLKEIQLLRRLGFNVIETNEEGKRVVNERATLVFMPHCSVHLINNFLYANWSEKLRNCVLLTNSFYAMVENSVRQEASEYVDYVSLIRPYTTEIALRNDFTCEEAFNDLTVHTFHEESIKKAPENFWLSRREPCYRDVTVEYITSAETRKA